MLNKKPMCLIMSIVLSCMPFFSVHAEENDAADAELIKIVQAYEEATVKAENGMAPNEIRYEEGKTTLVYSIDLENGEKAYFEYSEETISKDPSAGMSTYAMTAVGYGVSKIEVGETKQINYRYYNTTTLGGDMSLIVQVKRLTESTFHVFSPSTYVVPPVSYSVSYYNAAVTTSRDTYAVVEGVATLASSVTPLYWTWQMKLVFEPVSVGVGYEFWRDFDV